ncbi:MAG: hypothetical protein M0P91_08290 [Sulfuricurvum sp.]|jgi:predicted CXXCH cytochrome family protein|uniref:cytochrome c3 family protein n=1 Tax=Sulfuricurvum sp. TaxID=2025608 RepID=UPI0025E874E4|nr:cytochrome c3 family protein [Sulfuricurvum sp.]MCK9373183.1 hypothetical protein [Sulfuricurvum sp.]
MILKIFCSLGVVIFGLWASEGVEILHPVDKKIHHEAYTGLTVKVHDRNISKILILTDRNERYTLEMTRECDDVCSKTVKLHPGENTIRVWGYKGEHLAYEAKSELYYVSQSLKGYKVPPKFYKETFFHTDKSEKECEQCHDMSLNEMKGVAFVDVEESNCYMCHKKTTTGKYAHAPAVNWVCSSCHSGKREEKGKRVSEMSKYHVPDPIHVICYGCHEKNKEIWDRKKYRHLPFDAGLCNKCHNPHASEHSMFIREVPNVLCTECHGDKKFPPSMRDNSRCPGTQEPSCVKCHNPHASDNPYFLDEPRTHTVDLGRDQFLFKSKGQ